MVLPNKRGALFLKTHLAQVFGKSIWLPRIISAEELIAELSGLQTLEEIDLICLLYESYKECYGASAESFDSFAKWGQLILQDFNEIDRYLADSEQLYENLKDIKVIENWSLGEEELSEYQINYLKFMASLGSIYEHYSACLLAKGWAYQGLAYKQAVNHLKETRFAEDYDKILFCGFNALNAAELKIVNTFYLQKKADLLWDADKYYLNDRTQEAGHFLRNNFNLFKQQEPSFIEDSLVSAKDISIISVPRQIGQAQVVKQTLQRMLNEGIPMDKVAVVLANEKLLWPVLQQLPAAIEHVNITMQYPLRYTSTYSFIELLIQIQISFEKQSRKNKTIYHSDLISLLRQSLLLNYAEGKGLHLNPGAIIQKITRRNLSFITYTNLTELFGENISQLKPLLEPVLSVQVFCETIINILDTLKIFIAQQLNGSQNNLELEYLHIFYRHFSRVSDVLTTYPHFNDLHSFKQLFTQVLGNSAAPFLGEPLKGLQIMGVLETRTLDFDHVILVNANEGVLPSGKTINSFIPNDLKRAFGLPLYLEKDAIYAYHFYRLLQKATDITITYDSETDSFGKGEKSRFVTQLQLELATRYPEFKIREEVASYLDFPPDLKNVISVEKNKEVLYSILEKASSSELFGGLSPSGLITYKDCSLKFYFRYGALLKENKEVEESAEANTFGSILHLSLEHLYKTFSGKIITYDLLNNQLPKIDALVHESFISFFDKNVPMGKSLLQQEVIKVYVKKLMENDLRFILRLKHENQHLHLIALEQEYLTPITITSDGLEKVYYLKGKIDRIDSFRGLVRVIDYKNSVQITDKFTFDGFEKLFGDKNYNKQLQLLLYAYLLYKNKTAEANQLLPCIIPFKVFVEEPKYILGNDKKPMVLSDDFFSDFENELKQFISSIVDLSTPFLQTTDEDIHEFCPYKSVCNLGT